jgi:hypothetical protein
MFKKSLLFFLLLLVMSCSKAEKINASSGRPNIVIFLSDDQGWDDRGKNN